MKLVDQFVPVSKAKNQLLRLIREMAEKDEVWAITRDGVPSAVLLSAKRYEGLLETIEILSDPRIVRSLRKSIRQASRGKWRSEKDVFGTE